jgi:GNAT superfamily N-acetyltransferase
MANHLFFRTEWPGGSPDSDLCRGTIAPEEYHPVGVVMTQDRLLISYAGVVWKMLEHEGQSYKMYGLSGVFTFPSYRKLGYGTQVIKAAKELIEKSDGDIVIFTSKVQGFYERVGFLPRPDVRLLKGDANKPTVYDEMTFMLFLSPKGQRARGRFENTSIYFGPEVW